MVVYTWAVLNIVWILNQPGIKLANGHCNFVHDSCPQCYFWARSLKANRDSILSKKYSVKNYQIYIYGKQFQFFPQYIAFDHVISGWYRYVCPQETPQIQQPIHGPSFRSLSANSRQQINNSFELSILFDRLWSVWFQIWWRFYLLKPKEEVWR